MNGAFLHVATNHIPVIGVPAAVLLLAGGLLRKSREVVRASFLFFIVVALLTIFVLRTGGPAAHVLRSYPEVVRSQVHEHAEAGESAFWVVEAAGLLSLVGLFLSMREIPKKLAILVLLVGLTAAVAMGRVAHLGGLIRHPEIMQEEVPAPATTPAAAAPSAAH